MRMLVQAQWDTPAGNEAIRTGELREQIENLHNLKPESLHFTVQNGKRTAHIVLDVEQESQLPSILEPLFMGGNAHIEITPCLTRNDVLKGLKEAHLTN
jgi:hypothetical protein